MKLRLSIVISICPVYYFSHSTAQLLKYLYAVVQDSA